MLSIVGEKRDNNTNLNCKFGIKCRSNMHQYPTEGYDIEYVTCIQPFSHIYFFLDMANEC